MVIVASIIRMHPTPTHSQFKPGQSGHPRGRRKGSHNFKTDVKATLKAPVRLTRDGRPRKVSTEAMLLRLREKALGGDSRALENVLRIYQARVVCTENLNPDILMMKTAKDCVGLNGSGPLNRTRDWRIFAQRPMRSDVIVIASIGLQDPAQMRLA